MYENSSSKIERAPWPHRVAVGLVCATFPLIWVGGLVTTYDAGMAVPDWPSTYGYNLFLYPLSTWLSGPWDLFIEHGHRLLASLVGMVTIAFVLVTWRADDRVWMKRFALLCLSLVILQGVIGGLRVTLNENLLARIHGCVGPLFFAATVAAAAFTSRWWHSTARLQRDRPKITSRFIRSAWAMVLLVYLQIIMGAHLRHLNPSWSPQLFSVLVMGHIVMAFVLVAIALMLIYTSNQMSFHARLQPAVRILAAAVLLQACFGAAAWRVKYYWPSWLPQPAMLEGYSVSAESMLQTITLTLHVAMGSFVLAMALLVALRSSRFFRESDGPVFLGRPTCASLEVVG